MMGPPTNNNTLASYFDNAYSMEDSRHAQLKIEEERNYHDYRLQRDRHRYQLQMEEIRYGWGRQNNRNGFK
jgi:hypothetical protein